MQRKWITGLVAAVVLGMLACGGGGSEEYSDAIEVNQAFVAAMEAYLDGIEQAQSGTDMADAITAYAAEVETLAPRLKEVAEKYPQWKDRSKIPEAMKPITDKAEGLAKRMAGAMMKSMQYMQEPEVQEAQRRLAQSMTAMK